MGHDGLTLRQGVLESSEVAGEAASDKRFREIVDTHYDFIWRSLRRLGVAPGDTDDAAQQVFVTAARKLARIRPGCERSFLFQTALRTAADHRRTHRRRREAAASEDLDGDQVADDAPTAEDVVDLRRARRTLDAILDDMPLELRTVFALFELEQVTMAEISVLLELPAGTVASRLRRARREFRDRVAGLAQSQTLRGGDT
jgi:RNA polymerase sigma-70 factor (ECF subfamily)